jgi:tetratricopeptide (TPR) repeat protein
VTFLSPFSIEGHEQPYRPRGGEETLMRAIDGDPRRVIAIVGAAGAGTSRLAIELAKQSSRAFVLCDDGDPKALEELLRGATGRPMLVVDGWRARRHLQKFVERELHPRLAIVVPVRESSAPRLPALAGLSRASIAVIAIDGGTETEEEELIERDEIQRARDADDPRAYLLEALERSKSDDERAKIHVALGVMDRSDAHFEKALQLGDPGMVLSRWSRVLELEDRTDEAIAMTERWLAAEVERGSRLLSARARMRLAALRRDEAIALAAREDCRAIGDSGGECRALHLAATILIESDRFDSAIGLTRDALSVAEAIGDAATIGWARFVLGAAADGHADPAAARAHYENGVAAMREAGLPIPERLHDALATARAALQSVRPEPLADQDPSLISLSRRPR